jgi:colanic acid biosynthesis glycosyl transferase WcaI
VHENVARCGRRVCLRLMQIILLNRFFTPDTSAASQLVSDLSRHLVNCGYTVTVITSRRCSDNSYSPLPAREEIDGVHVVRGPRLGFGQGALVARALNYLAFAVFARGQLARLVRPGDVVVEMTDPPLLSAWLLSSLSATAARVHWHQDLVPEVAYATGVLSTRGWLGRYAASRRDTRLGCARSHVVVNEGMGERLLERGVAPERLHVIHNWALPVLEPASDPRLDGGEQRYCGAELRAQFGLTDEFVVAYSGNFGRVHEFDMLLSALSELASERRIRFFLIGQGMRYGVLRQAVRAAGLENVVFAPHPPVARLAQVLSLADAHLVSLRPEVERLAMPSKLYSIAALGKPIIAIVEPSGEVGTLVREHRCGAVVAPGDTQALVGAILAMANDAKVTSDAGINARTLYEARFPRASALEQWRALIARMAATAS